MLLKYLPFIKKKSKINGVFDEDLFQDIIYSVIDKGIEKFDPERGVKFLTYLGYIVANKAIDYKKKKTIDELDSLDENVSREVDVTFVEMLESELSVEKDHMKNSRFSKLYKLIEMLSDRDKYIIIRYYGLFGQATKTMKEIAKDKNISQQRVNCILKEIEKSFKKMLDWENYK